MTRHRTTTVRARSTDFDAPDAILRCCVTARATRHLYTSQTTEEDGTLYGIDVGLVVLEESYSASRATREA